MATKEMMVIYDLMLNGAGMREEFKLNLSISRRHLLMLCFLADQAVSPGKEKAVQMSALLSQEAAGELTALIPELLKKGGPRLVDYFEKLKTICP